MVKFIKTEKEEKLAGAQRRGKVSDYLTDKEFLFRRLKNKFWKWIEVMNLQHYEYSQGHWITHLKWLKW